MLDIVIDAQAGSCGKGKTAAHLALLTRPHFVIANFGPNAGHTVYLNQSLPPSLQPPFEAPRLVFRHLPAGAVCGSATVFLGAGSVIDPLVLHQEMDALMNVGINVAPRLHIHPRAAIIVDEDKAIERCALRSIASTMKGVGSAQARKVMRQAGLAADHRELQPYTAEWLARPRMLLDELDRRGSHGICETSQGFDLCLNHGLSYPHCTSRQISVAQALADCGLPPAVLGNVYGVLRPYPIRVGNVVEDGMVAGWSGPYASDNVETSWAAIAERAGMPPDELDRLLAQERTTVTGRQRRVFTFSWLRFRLFCAMNRPTYLVLNFADQIAWTDRGKDDYHDLSQKTTEFASTLEAVAGAPVRFIGTGPGETDVCDLIL